MAVFAVGLTFIKPVQNVVNQTVGSVANPDIQFPYFSFGGNRYWAAHTDSLIQGTTTVCALQSPAATSTLVSASVSFKISSTTASNVVIAKAASAFATTTALNYGAFASGAQGTMMASSTITTNLTNVDPYTVFAPNQFVVVGMQGGIGTFSPVGTCQATWIQTSY